MDIQKLLHPDAGKFYTVEDETLAVDLVDEELDAFTCVFHNDECATIDTEELSYLVLNKGNLYAMIEAIEAAEEHYKDAWSSIS